MSNEIAFYIINFLIYTSVLYKMNRRISKLEDELNSKLSNNRHL
ncbi:hypothetical protein J23TS9_19620 [Paenibacillus sp. J23TS9]|nr:hypothetical protein J23TS9_19620 [Paenibacillus sp. J23TS9]